MEIRVNYKLGLSLAWIWDALILLEMNQFTIDGNEGLIRVQICL